MVKIKITEYTESIIKINEFLNYLDDKFIGKPIDEKTNHELKQEIKIYTKRLLHYDLILKEFEEDFNEFLNNIIEIK